MDRYEKLERKHLGDIDKGTAIYASVTLADGKNDRASILGDQLTCAEFKLSSIDFNDDKNKPHIEDALQDVKHAEYGLKNLSKGITLEAEVKSVLKMSPENRQKHYQSVLKEGGQKAVDELIGAVKKERTRSKGMEM